VSTSGADAQAGAGTAQGAGEDISRAQLLANLRRGHGLSRKARTVGREKVFSRGFWRARDDVFGDAFAQVLVLLGAAQIFEIEHGNRLLRRQDAGTTGGRNRRLGLFSRWAAARVEVALEALQVGAKFGAVW